MYAVADPLQIGAHEKQARHHHFPSCVTHKGLGQSKFEVTEECGREAKSQLVRSCVMSQALSWGRECPAPVLSLLPTQTGRRRRPPRGAESRARQHTGAEPVSVCDPWRNPHPACGFPSLQGTVVTFPSFSTAWNLFSSSHSMLCVCHIQCPVKPSQLEAAKP